MSEDRGVRGKIGEEGPGKSCDLADKGSESEESGTCLLAIKRIDPCVRAFVALGVSQGGLLWATLCTRFYNP